jgi:threonylcarbamoyladenosine tRNA methylthiotransferase MtaB
VPVQDVVAQVQRLVDSGAREVVITGVDVTSYGPDLPGEPTLGQLLRRILAAVPALPRLRLSSLDAVEMDDDLLRLVAEEPRLMPHFHLSLQAGDDLILKRMKRRHLRHHAIDLAAELRRLRPDCALGADIITGFPTETEAMFQNSLDLVDACGLTYLHVFPYSERDGTPAAKMPPVAKADRKERAARLRAKGALAKSAFLSAQQGETVSVLFEKDGWGRTPNFASVRRLDGSTPAPGTIESLRLVDLNDGILMGVPH